MLDTQMMTAGFGPSRRIFRRRERARRRRIAVVVLVVGCFVAWATLFESTYAAF